MGCGQFHTHRSFHSAPNSRILGAVLTQYPVTFYDLRHAIVRESSTFRGGRGEDAGRGSLSKIRDLPWHLEATNDTALKPLWRYLSTSCDNGV